MNAIEKKPTAVPPIPPLSENSPKADAAPGKGRFVHMVSMSKGGVGKSLVGWLLLQYLQDKGRTVSGVDLDPMTHTLAEFSGLGVRTVELLTGPDMTFNGPAMDQLAEDMLTSEGSDFVLDNGAAGFVALTRYLCDNAFPGLLKGFGGRLVVHAVMAGGSAATQCLVGLHTLQDAFGADRDDVKFVIWLNEHPGPFVVNGMGLVDTKLYKDMIAEGRIMGLVRLEKLSAAFLDDFERMRGDLLTFGEAIASPKFLLMNRQRLTILRRKIWDQLDGIGLVP